ncbi:hypothetical protein [Nocardia rhizosphaerae]|uniref:Tetratricopeptide repeat protein n=1 Tax=Nocardia rhizosphaerae TaxID=1691571 RepID=A0ABV8LDE1_9NOCA
MTDPGTRHPGDSVPLDQRYTGADPIEWCGAAVYPMYTESLAAGTTAVRLRAVSVMPPAGVAGLGLGLTVQDGHVNLDGRSLAGVDIWSDALAGGVDIAVTADAPEALFTLTPVWVAGSGAQQSWTGNYGMVVDLLPNGASTLWCSTGPGTPDFNELVVELTTVQVSDAATAEVPPALATMPLTILSPAAVPRPEQIAPPSTPVGPPAEVIAGPRTAAVSPPEAAELAAAPPQPTPASRTPIAPPPQPVASPGMPVATAPQPTAPPRAGSAGPTVSAPTPTTAPAVAVQAPPITPTIEPDPAPTDSAGSGIGRALYELGTAMHERGDHDSARALLTQAAEAGHGAAAYELGALLLRAGDRAGAEYWWKAAADDDARAAASLSELTQRA